MCVYSMIGDHFNDKWQPIQQPFQTYIQGVSQQEFDKLKDEVLEMKKLLERAIKYDKEHNEPSCQTEEKVKLLKEMAKVFGIELPEFPKEK